MDLPIARDEAWRAQRAFEGERAPLDGWECDGDGVVGERVATAFGEAQPHRITIPVEVKIEFGEVALAMSQRESVIFIEYEG